MRISYWSSDVCSSDLIPLRDQFLEIGQIRLFGRIGVMVRKMPVDIGEEKMMLAGQARDELFDHRPCGAVARVPADAARAAAESVDPQVDIGVDDIDLLTRALAALPVARCSEFAHPQDDGAAPGAPPTK